MMCPEIISLNKLDRTIHLNSSVCNSHYDIVYRDLVMLRKLYPRLIKQLLEINNNTVLFLPFYDSVIECRKQLSKNEIDVKCENIEESLIIIDAAKAYFGSSINVISFIDSLSNLVEETGILLRNKNERLLKNYCKDLIENLE